MAVLLSGVTELSGPSTRRASSPPQLYIKPIKITNPYHCHENAHSMMMSIGRHLHHWPHRSPSFGWSRNNTRTFFATCYEQKKKKLRRNGNGRRQSFRVCPTGCVCVCRGRTDSSHVRMKWRKISCDFVIITLDIQWTEGVAATPRCAYAGYYYFTCGHRVIRSFAYSVGRFQYVVLAFITSRCRNQVGAEGRRRAFECELMNWEMTGGFPMARTWNNRQLVHFAGRIPPFSVRPSVSQSEDGMVPLKPNYDVIRFGNFSSLTRNRGEERGGREGWGAETRETTTTTRCCQLEFANL